MFTVGIFKAKDIEFRRVIHSGFFSNSGSKRRRRKYSDFESGRNTNLLHENQELFKFWSQIYLAPKPAHYTNYLILRAQGIPSLKV